MMAQKHLHELLKEDQEPFLLNKYISDKRSQIKRPCLQVMTKHKPLHRHQDSNFPGNLCKNVCLFSFQDTTTPDLRKSPLFEFASPITKSPTKSPNAIFLHIPSRTATLLLEAALKIHKHKHSSSISTSKTKTKTQNTSNGFGLLGSLFKRLTQRNQNRKREIEGSNNKVSVKDILRWDSSVGRRKLSNGCIKEQEKLDFSTNNNNNMGNNGNVGEVGFTCSYNGRSSSAVWSESNEDKSLDMETSSSSSSISHCDEDDDSQSQQIDFGTNQKHNIECASSCCHDINGFCESPFRFVLQSSPSSGSHTPELPSPAPSPTRHRTEDKVSNGAESLNKFQSVEEEEEDKEQCSPVSVLDPPFEDDDEGHGNDDEEDSSDLKCSYAIVQRAKQQLLYKLRRFEKLAGLDPVELEKRMLDEKVDEDEYEDEAFMEEDDYEDGDSEASYKENDLRELVFEALCHSSVHERQQIPEDLKKLVSDLIDEEDRELDSLKDRDMVIRRVCKRLELWKEVESNTIDMMIEEDFSREEGGWKKNMEQIREIAGELELAIFGFLVEEFAEELVC